MWHILFDGNIFWDDQPTLTQLYAFQVETANSTSIISNTLGASNHVAAYAATMQMFNPSVTPAMVGEMFNFAPVGGIGIQFTTVAFADLANVNTAQLRD